MRFSVLTIASLSMISMTMALPYEAVAPVEDITELIARAPLASSVDGIHLYKGEPRKLLVEVTRRDVENNEDEDAEDVEIEAPEEEESTAVIAARNPAPSGELGKGASAVAIVNGIIDIATKVNKIVGGILGKDIKRRQAFTQQTVSNLRRQFPATNFVMSNVGYSFNGKVIAKKQVFYHNKVGARVSYDIIGFKRGTFVLRGDGGFQNVRFPHFSFCIFRRISCKKHFSSSFQLTYLSQWAAIYDSTCRHNGKTISC